MHESLASMMHHRRLAVAFVAPTIRVNSLSDLALALTKSDCRVILAPGVYSVSTPLAFSGRNLTFDGQGATLRAANGSTIPDLLHVSGAGATLRNLTLDGNRVNRPNQVGLHNLYLNGASAVTLDNVQLLNPVHAGLLASGVTTGRLTGCTFDGDVSWSNGSYIYSNSDTVNLTAEGCAFQNVGSAGANQGLYLYLGTWTFQDCTFTNCYKALDIRTDGKCAVQRCTLTGGVNGAGASTCGAIHDDGDGTLVEDTQITGYLGLSEVLLFSGSNTVFRRNTVTGRDDSVAAQTLCRFNAASAMQLTGNTFRGTQYSNSVAFRLENGSTGIALTGNAIAHVRYEYRVYAGTPPLATADGNAVTDVIWPLVMEPYTLIDNSAGYINVVSGDL